jgi:hypothetical protein
MLPVFLCDPGFRKSGHCSAMKTLALFIIGLFVLMPSDGDARLLHLSGGAAIVNLPILMNDAGTVLLTDDNGNFLLLGQ